MKNRIIAILAGVVAGVIVTSLGEMINHQIYPLPEGLDFTDKEQVQSFVDSLPMGAMMMLLVTWMISSWVGGMVTGKIVKGNWKPSVLITGGILMLAAILNMLMIPHPLWLIIATIGQYLPLAYLGGWMVNPKSK